MVMYVDENKLRIAFELAKGNKDIDTESLVQLVGVVDRPPLPKPTESTIVKETLKTPLSKQDIANFVSDMPQAMSLFDEEEPKEIEPINARKKWTRTEEKNLLEMYRMGVPPGEIATNLNRSEKAVKIRLDVLEELGRFKRIDQKNKPYNEEEILLLMDTFHDYGDVKKIPKSIIRYLAKELNRTNNAIISQMHNIQNDRINQSWKELYNDYKQKENK